jgi:hypothetical protein
LDSAESSGIECLIPFKLLFQIFQTGFEVDGACLDANADRPTFFLERLIDQSAVFMGTAAGLSGIGPQVVQFEQGIELG